MDMNKMIGLIIGVTVSIIIFVSVLAPTIYQATQSAGVDPDSGDPLPALLDDPTWITLVGVCGTLAIIAILMMVVRALGNKA